MTCIAAWIENNVVYMGGDSLCGIRIMKDPKVWKSGEFMFGVSGELLGYNIMRNSFKPPQILPDESLTEYMSTRFVAAMRELFKARQYEQTKDEKPWQYNHYIVGIRGRLFEVNESYTVLEVADSFTAIGCGKMFALGAMKTDAQRTDLTPEDRIRRSLEVAAYFDYNVKGPFNIISETRASSN